MIKRSTLETLKQMFQGRPLSDRAVKALREQMKASETKLGGVTPIREQVLFPIHLSEWQRQMECLWAETRIVGLTFHDLRHEATSRLFEKGLNPVEVATITGHKDTRMLMRYTHLRAEDLVKKLG